MGAETTWTGVGRPAFEAFREVVTRVRAGDPLAPVAVVTTSPAAAVGLRRAMTRAHGGMAAVSFQSLDALAEQLAAPLIGHRGIAAGIDRELVVAAVRVELARSPGRFAGIEHHRSTWETIARAVDEIAALSPDARSSVVAGGGLGAEVVRIHDAVAASVALGGRVAVLRAATERARRRPDAARALGPVVVHCPDRLDGASIELLRSLADAGDVHLVVALTGQPDADRPVVEAAAAVAGGSCSVEVTVPVPTQVITANDVDDEVRAAVRAILVRAEAGTPLHAMALVHPAGAPYARQVAEVLRATGMPFSGPGTESLGQTAAGRVILGLLEVARTDFARQAVIDLWSSGVVIAPGGGPVPSVLVDERTRRLGIVGGRTSWHERLEGRRRWLDEHPVATDAPPDVVERRTAWRAEERAELDLVASLLLRTEELVDALPDRWSAVGDWASHVLDVLCGPHLRRTDWPDHELDADDAIRTALGRLEGLETVDPSPIGSIVAGTVRATLDRPGPRRGRAGAGLHVTTVDQPPVVPVEVVVVVGLSEGHVPRLTRDDVLVTEAVRRAADLPLPADHTVDQHRHLLTALGSATTERVLTYARSDQRSGRTQVPSRWLVDAVERIHGERPRSETLIAGRPVAGVEVVHSHQAAVERIGRGASAPLHAAERRLAALVSAADFDTHPAARHPVVEAGATLARSRSATSFTRFDGNVGEGIDILAEGRHLSPTSIETYATCPRRWFFGHALGVGDVDRPEQVDRLQARDKGTLAHRILERFVGEAIEAGSVPAPGEPWGPEGDERLLAIAEEEFADFERRGLTGHERWWDHDRHEITGVLVETLRRDDRLRADAGATPVAVELTFGRDDVAPLAVELDDGRTVLLAGQADRVDEVPGGVMVHDYKFASSGPYRGLDRAIDAGGDPVAGGRRLQLLAYAEAAAQQRGIDRTSAWYWFLKPGHTGTRIGYEIGPHHRRLFRETLRVLVDGIGAGLFPARSGQYDWWQGTNVNCGWCEFDGICPADREEEWERVRSDPSLADVVRLSEDGAPAFLVTAPLEVVAS